MNKPSSPWSVKGVSPAAREAAKEGARISQQSLGKWLSQVIRVTSEREGASPSSDKSEISTREAQSVAQPSSAVTWQEAIVRLESRIEESHRTSSESLVPVEQALSRISERLDAMETYVLRRPRPSYLGRLFRR
jgi:localization factor PodJL